MNTKNPVLTFIRVKEGLTDRQAGRLRHTGRLQREMNWGGGRQVKERGDRRVGEISRGKRGRDGQREMGRGERWGEEEER